MINLQVIIDGLEMVDDMNTVFLDLKTGDTVYLSDFDPSLTEDTAELLEEYPDRFLRLPDQREIFVFAEKLCCFQESVGCVL